MKNNYLLAVLVVFILSTMQATAQSWTITGNTNATNTSVLGTKNTFPLRLIVNNLERVLVDADGRVGVGTTAPDASAILDVSSTNRGVLFPRLSKAQRNLVASPAEGLVIYQTDNNPGIYYYKGGWKRITDGTFANPSLANLKAPTAIRVDLLSDTSYAPSLGSAVSNWKNIYFNGGIFYDTGRFISAGNNNSTFVGISSGISNTTGMQNTATGYQSLYLNSTGFGNVANGFQAMYNSTNSYNSGFGFQALKNSTSGYANHAAGAYSLYANTTGSYNVACGPDALISNTTGVANTAIGLDALRSLSTTSYNTGVGYYAGSNSSGSGYCTFLGSEARGAANLINATSIGYQAYAAASNQIMLGNSSVNSVKAAGSYVIYSDGRFKKDIREEVPGLTFINALRPVTYHYDIHGLNAYMQPAKTKEKLGVVSDLKVEGVDPLLEELIKAKEKMLYSGFIAQEVEETAKKLNYDFSGVYKPANKNDVYGLSYSEFVVPLVKAVQELSKKAEELEKKASRVDELEARLQKLEHLLTDANNASNNLSENVSLDQNSPNPFSTFTTITFDIPQNFQTARIQIKDVSGKLLKIVPITTGGKGVVKIDASTLNSGTYAYSIIVNGKLAATKKMVIVKQ